MSGSTALRIQAPDNQSPVQRLQRYNVTTLQADMEVRLPEAVLDVSPAATSAINPTRLWPPTVTALELGQTGQTQLIPRGVAADRRGNAYLLTFSGLSIVSLAQTSGRGPAFRADGVVNGASFQRPLSPGSIISIFGNDLADSETAGGVPLPRMLGGVCVTANEVAIPLFATSPTQINAQMPSDLGTGRVTLTVRSPRLGRVSAGVQVDVGTASPGVFAVESDGQKRAALFHADDFAFVTPRDPAKRDQDFILYVTGLGQVNPAAPAGEAGAASPLSVATQRISVVIGGHPMIVTFAGLAPGFVGLYQINIRVPGDRVQGDNLPVVVTAAGVSSLTTDAPLTSVH